MRIGLLGGSFNPAHEGHLHIATMALKRLRLDQVWLLVSPGNPLKEAHGMRSLAERRRSAQGIADGRRIIATDIEQYLHARARRRGVWPMPDARNARHPYWPSPRRPHGCF
jgi:nicotinate-nucleotide adenylyltransferase